MQTKVMDFLSSIIDKLTVKPAEPNKGWLVCLERNGHIVLSYRRVFASEVEAYSKIEELRKPL